MTWPYRQPSPNSLRRFSGDGFRAATEAPYKTGFVERATRRLNTTIEQQHSVSTVQRTNICMPSSPAVEYPEILKKAGAPEPFFNRIVKGSKSSFLTQHAIR